MKNPLFHTTMVEEKEVASKTWQEFFGYRGSIVS